METKRRHAWGVLIPLWIIALILLITYGPFLARFFHGLIFGS